MSSFTEKISIEPLLKKRFWHKQRYIFTKPFSYTTNEGLVITIHQGFTLDFASTPFWIHWFYPPRGWYSKAVAIHDKGYKNHNNKSQAWWDNIMKEAMTVLALKIAGSPIPKEMQKTINRFYWAVTTFGKRAWNK